MDDLDKVKYVKRQVFSKILNEEKKIIEYKDEFGHTQYFLINEIKDGKMYGTMIKKQSFNFFDLNEFVKRDFRISHFKTIEESVKE